MQTIRTLAELRAGMIALRHDHGSVAFVPTMGALHDGHLTLVREAKRKADHVVASVFPGRRTATTTIISQHAGVVVFDCPGGCLCRPPWSMWNVVTCTRCWWDSMGRCTSAVVWAFTVPRMDSNKATTMTILLSLLHH